MIWTAVVVAVNASHRNAIGADALQHVGDAVAIPVGPDHVQIWPAVMRHVDAYHCCLSMMALHGPV